MKAQRDKLDLQLSEPNQVVAEYLESLLSEVEEYKEPVKEVAIALPLQQQKTIEAVDLVVTSAQPCAMSEVEARPQPFVPHWAKERFQCLLFEINGLHLAVPLSELNSIAGNQKMTTMHLMGQPEWHRGILKHRMHKVGVVDVARLVMPGKLPAVKRQTVSPSHVLIIGDGEWGLMCDKLLSPIMVEPDDIHWSCRHKNRAWMAGTLPDQLCIILDLDVLLTMIHPVENRLKLKTGMNCA